MIGGQRFAVLWSAKDRRRPLNDSTLTLTLSLTLLMIPKAEPSCLRPRDRNQTIMERTLQRATTSLTMLRAWLFVRV